MPYYLFDGKTSIGPFEPAQLVARPGFDAATLVFPAGATTADAWKPAGSFPDLAAALKPRAAAPPPPPPPPSSPALSEITLTLPPRKIAAAAPAPAASAPDAADAPAAEAAPALASPADKLLLLIDDDESVRSFLELTASAQGFQIVTAVNGLDAAAKIATRAPDLIVTDLMMPGQGGYEFLRSLQASGGGRIPVFVVTGSVLDNSTVQMIRQEANVVEFIAKPVRVPAFVAALHKHLKTAPRK